INELELFPEFYIDSSDLEEAYKKLDLAWGRKEFSRDELFITTRSWNKFIRKPKTKDAFDRSEENLKRDLHQLIFILKHIILEKSGASQKELNDQIMNLLKPRGTKLHTDKINNFFSEANSHEIEILRKNIITIFKNKTRT